MLIQIKLNSRNGRNCMPRIIATTLLRDNVIRYYSAKLLRPVSLVARVGESGIDVIESVYPQVTRGVIAPPPPAPKRK